MYTVRLILLFTVTDMIRQCQIYIFIIGVTSKVHMFVVRLCFTVACCLYLKRLEIFLYHFCSNKEQQQVYMQLLVRSLLMSGVCTLITVGFVSRHHQLKTESSVRRYISSVNKQQSVKWALMLLRPMCLSMITAHFLRRWALRNLPLRRYKLM